MEEAAGDDATTRDCLMVFGVVGANNACEDVDTYVCKMEFQGHPSTRPREGPKSPASGRRTRRVCKRMQDTSPRVNESLWIARALNPGFCVVLGLEDLE